MPSPPGPPESSPFAPKSLTDPHRRYTSLHSPYWTPRHVKLRAFLRRHYDTYLLPHAGEWEAAGVVPDAAWEQHAKLGFVAAAIYPGVEEKYYSGIPELGDIKRIDWDIWCDFLVSLEWTVHPCGARLRPPVIFESQWERVVMLTLCDAVLDSWPMNLLVSVT